MKNHKAVYLWIFILFVFDLFVWQQVLVYEPAGNAEVYFLDVGQGDSELVVLPEGVKILIDGGPDKKILSQLDSALRPTDRYIDLIVLSHAQSDHFNGLIDVLKRYRVGAFIFNGRGGTALSWLELKKAVKDNEVPVVILSAGDRISCKDSKLEFLLPDGNFISASDLNETALVALLESQKAKILFTGDIGKKAEDYLADNYALSVDVLKVAHHGSRFSSGEKFLKIALPEIAVIEVGKNSYGHPAEEVLERLSLVGSRIFRTDEDKTIKLVIDGKKIDVFSAKQ